jgi:hypothetical protein
MTEQEYINEFVKAHSRFAKFGITLHKITKIEALNEFSKTSSITDDYWTLGSLMEEIKVGSPIWLARVANKNYPAGRDGVFSTSKVVDYKDGIAITQNSRYKIEKLV